MELLVFQIRNMHIHRNVYTNINKVGFLSFMKDKEYGLCNNIGTTCTTDLNKHKLCQENPMTGSRVLKE